MLLSQVYCVWQVVKTLTIILNNPVFYISVLYILYKTEWRKILNKFFVSNIRIYIHRKEKIKTTNWIRGTNYKRNWTEPTYMVRPCPKNGRMKITQNSVEVDGEIKESTRKTKKKKQDGRYKEGHERKKPKWRSVER